MKTIPFLFLLLFVLSYCPAQSQAAKTFTDPRDKKVYPIIFFEDIKSVGKLNFITWMAKDMNYKTASGYTVVEDKDMHNQAQGLLYTWEAARKACPAGWHLPSEKEWQPLVDTFNGRSLKSSEGWAMGGNGENFSGFSAYPSYYLSDEVEYPSYKWFGHWWTATSKADTLASAFLMVFQDGDVRNQARKKTDSYSVRCIKD